MDRYRFDSKEKLYEVIKKIAPSSANDLIRKLEKNQEKCEKQKSKEEVVQVEAMVQNYAIAQNQNAIETEEDYSMLIPVEHPEVCNVAS